MTSWISFVIAPALFSSDDCSLVPYVRGDYVRLRGC